ncbi:MAG: hypothetical protein OJF52_002198 [Nitrospira sp.]|jgi:DNA-binding NtrC family response regulator|nr:MAG: hypothetical protein OJF52_002198 [Nitrospira sp.]
MAKDEEIRADDLPLELATTKEWAAALDRILPSDAGLDAILQAVEEHLITRALTQAHGVQARAADQLKTSRSLLQYKLKRRQEFQ